MTNTGSTPRNHALGLEISSRRFVENGDLVLELCEILSHFCWKKSLLAFGSTCKALFELAMDILWHSLNDLIDLLKVIPNFVQVDKEFVCHLISNKFAHLTIASRQSWARSRMVP